MEHSNSGIGIFTVIGIVFVILKLTGVIATWSWWLVLLPFYGPLIVVVAVLLIAALIVAIFK